MVPFPSCSSLNRLDVKRPLWAEPYHVIGDCLEHGTLAPGTPEWLSSVYLPQKAADIVINLRQSTELGASALTKKALEMFETFLQAHVESLHDFPQGGGDDGMIPMGKMNLERVVCHVCDILRLIAYSKPSMACLKNATSHAIQELQKSLMEESGPIDVIGGLLTSLSVYYCWETEAALRTAQNAAELVASQGFNSVMVFSNTSMVENAIVTACRNRNVTDALTVMVFVPRHPRETGIDLSAKLLRDIEPEPGTISVRVVHEEQIDEAMTTVDCCLVGADAVFESGGFVNEVGTKTLALAARRAAQVPLYVVCRSDKMILKTELVGCDDPALLSCQGGSSHGTSLAVSAEEQYLEYIDSSLVHSYITEDGIMSPSKIKDQIRSSN